MVRISEFSVGCGKLAGWAIVICLACAQVAEAAVLWNDELDELGSVGYLRAGGGNSGGNTQTCFKAPGAGAKYRLGNECEAYGRVSVYYRHRLHETDSAPYLHAELQPEFKGIYGKDFAYQAMAQAYVEMGNLADSPLKVWVGRRHYKRRDIHINDYFYMNLKGDGLGVRDIPLGYGELSYTYLQMYDVLPNTGLTSLEHRVAMRNHEIGLYNIRSNSGGTVMLDGRYAEIATSVFMGAGGPVSTPGANGWAFSVQHRQEGIIGGANTVALQYGRGAARSAWSTPTESASGLARLNTPASAADLDAAKTWRLIDFHLYEGNKWAMQSAFIWERRSHARFDGTDSTWMSVGARPMWYLDNHWRLVGEAGYDHVINRTASTRGHLLKVSAAAEWAPNPGFFGRPAVRAYVTQAVWSDSLRGQTGTPEFGTGTRGWNTGLQVETWW